MWSANKVAVEIVYGVEAGVQSLITYFQINKTFKRNNHHLLLYPKNTDERHLAACLSVFVA
jgi:hypothetical protein